MVTAQRRRNLDIARAADSTPWLVSDDDDETMLLPEWIEQDTVYDDLDEIPRDS